MWGDPIGNLDYKRLSDYPEETLGYAEQGDFEMGAGLSTSQLQNPNVDLSSGAAPAPSPWTNSLAVWGVFVGLLLLVKYTSEKSRPDEFKSVRVGFENVFLVGGMAVLFIFALKIVAAKLPFKPLQQFAGVI